MYTCTRPNFIPRPRYTDSAATRALERACKLRCGSITGPRNSGVTRCAIRCTTIAAGRVCGLPQRGGIPPRPPRWTSLIGGGWSVTRFTFEGRHCRPDLQKGPTASRDRALFFCGYRPRATSVANPCSMPMRAMCEMARIPLQRLLDSSG